MKNSIGGFEILLEPRVQERDLPKISLDWRLKIKLAISGKLSKHPTLYGKPLRHSLHGFFKLRVGDYRVIFSVSGNKVIIATIRHRKDGYDDL